MSNPIELVQKDADIVTIDLSGVEFQEIPSAEVTKKTEQTEQKPLEDIV